MALSEEEQRLLDELEASLAADDPRLAQTLGTKTSYKVHRRRAALAGVLFVAGILLLLVGIYYAQWIVGLLGFIAMFAATVIGITSWEKADDSGSVQNRRPTFGPAGGNGHHSGPFTSLDERWRRRQGER